MARAKVMPVAITCMLKTLNRKQGANMQELIEETGLHRETLSNYLNVFARHHLIYVLGWEQDAINRFSIRRWKWGQAQDAVQPRVRGPTRAQLRERWREQKRAQVRRKARQLLNQAMYFKP